jgi:hypothetical protein
MRHLIYFLIAIGLGFIWGFATVGLRAINVADDELWIMACILANVFLAEVLWARGRFWPLWAWLFAGALFPSLGGLIVGTFVGACGGIPWMGLWNLAASPFLMLLAPWVFPLGLGQAVLLFGVGRQPAPPQPTP